MAKFYATFQQRYAYDTHPVFPDVCHRCYLVIEAADYTEARQKAFELLDNDFSFMYDEEEFEGQPEKYDLHELTTEETP
jgi:hypothetical protein